MLEILLGALQGSSPAVPLEFTPRASSTGHLSVELPRTWRVSFGEFGRFEPDSPYWGNLDSGGIGLLAYLRAKPEIKIELVARGDFVSGQDVDSFVVASYPRKAEEFGKSASFYGALYSTSLVREMVAGREVYRLRLPTGGRESDRVFDWYLIPIDQSGRTYILSFVFVGNRVFEPVQIMTRAVESFTIKNPPSPVVVRAKAMGPG